MSFCYFKAVLFYTGEAIEDDSDDEDFEDDEVCIFINPRILCKTCNTRTSFFFHILKYIIVIMNYISTRFLTARLPM